MKWSLDNVYLVSNYVHVVLPTCPFSWYECLFFSLTMVLISQTWFHPLCILQSLIFCLKIFLSSISCSVVPLSFKSLSISFCSLSLSLNSKARVRFLFVRLLLIMWNRDQKKSAFLSWWYLLSFSPCHANHHSPLASKLLLILWLNHSSYNLF